MTADGLSLLGQIPASVLSTLTSRILSRIPQIQFGDVLSNEELEKLAAATSLTASESQCLVESLTAFFRTAAYASKRPASLKKELRESAAEIPDEQLEALTEAWTKDAAAVVRSLKTESSSLTGGCWVDDLSWELGVSLASSSSSSSSTPPTPSCKAVLNFNLTDTSLPSCTGSSSFTTISSAYASDQISLEFNHREIYDFYLKLETIQERIDALGK